MKLLGKFNIVMLFVFLACFLIMAWLLYEVLFSIAREQVLQNARIVMASANAIRDYTADELTPLLPLERKGVFVAETVPAFAAQSNFKKLQKTLPSFSYREPALNPTNREDRATDWEADIIQEFRNKPGTAELVLERETPIGRSLVLSRPVTITNEVCLDCHGEPALAPAPVTKTYGTANGFGWKLGETVGAQIVSVPMKTPLALAWDAYVKFLLGLVALAAVLAAILSVLLHVLVVGPAKRIAKVADAVSLGDEGIEEYVRPGNDEMSALSAAFNRMRHSLRLAMGMRE